MNWNKISTINSLKIFALFIYLVFFQLFSTFLTQDKFNSESFYRITFAQTKIFFLSRLFPAPFTVLFSFFLFPFYMFRFVFISFLGLCILILTLSLYVEMVCFFHSITPKTMLIDNSECSESHIQRTMHDRDGKS